MYQNFRHGLGAINGDARIGAYHGAEGTTRTRVIGVAVESGVIAFNIEAVIRHVDNVLRTSRWAKSTTFTVGFSNFNPSVGHGQNLQIELRVC